MKLDNKFYDEFLYIVGLKDNKNQIVFNGIENSLAGQLLNGSELTDDKMQILISWITKILFFKLLELDIVGFNDQSYKFLDKIKDFKELDDLFFCSGYFEPNNDHIDTLKNLPIPIYPKSILNKAGELPVLNYLFEFLEVA